MSEEQYSPENLVRGMQEEINSMVEQFNEMQAELQDLSLAVTAFKRKQAEFHARHEMFKQRYYKEVAGGMVQQKG